MKKIFIILLLALNFHCYFSQENKIFATYEFTNAVSGKPFFMKAKLFIADNLSLYTINPKDIRTEKTKDIILYNESENKIIKNVYLPNENDFFLVTNKKKDSIKHTTNIGSDKYLITEGVYPFNWEIKNKNKKIGKFNCIKATVYFRGRNYIAWYSPEIPIRFGPWKFSGLPGLILEIYDQDNKFSWKIKSIVYPFKEILDISIANVNSYKKIELKNYVALKGQSTKDYSGFLKSKSPKGTKFRDMTIKRSGIELLYEWE